jgi:hypothetical protein
MATLPLPLISYKNVVIDVVILSTIYFIPALSHAAPFSLHYLEPMRLLLFVGYLLCRNDINSSFLAMTIPFVSTVITGHPPAAKAVLISCELLVNLWFLIWISEKFKWNAGIAFFVSALASKLVYYLFKFAFLELGLIQGTLVSTPLSIQLVALVVLSIMFAMTRWVNSQVTER